MKASSHAVVITLAAALSATPGVRAQTPAPAAETAPASAPAAVAAPATTTPVQPAPEARRRPISSGLAASLAATMPKYAPPPEPKPKTPEEEEADKPRNQIIRLPQVVVEGDRPPVFTERQLYTQAELARLAARRYLSELDRGVLNRYTVPLFGQTAEARAMSIYEDEERQRNIASANQAVYLLKQTGNDAEASSLKRDAADAYLRPSEFTRISTER